MHYALLSICVLDYFVQLFMWLPFLRHRYLKMVGICWQAYDFGCFCTNFVWYWIGIICESKILNLPYDKLKYRCTLTILYANLRFFAIFSCFFPNSVIQKIKVQVSS